MRERFASLITGVLIAVAVALGIVAALASNWPTDKDPEWYGGDRP